MYPCLSVCVTFVFRYEIILKQSVGTEDLFLGLNGKDPSSMCCEAMLVIYRLPQDFYTSLNILFFNGENWNVQRCDQGHKIREKEISLLLQMLKWKGNVY